MDRRDILRVGAAGFVALSIPGWNFVFGRSGADRSAETEPSPILRRAIADARRRGRPLILLHAPKCREKHGARSYLWGIYFREVHAAGLIDLALCDVVCAFDAEIELEFPALAEQKWKSDIALFLDPDAAVPVVVPGPESVVRGKGTWAEVRQDARDLVEVVHAKLHALIAADDAMLARRVRQNRDALTEAEQQTLGDLDRPIRVRKEHVRSVPAWVLTRARAEPLRGEQWLEWLREEAQYRYRVASPAGSLWGSPGGCGVVLERYGHQFGSGPCGMSLGSAESLRFLYFYTEDEIAEFRRS
jgi:hypothetical protein